MNDTAYCPRTPNLKALATEPGSAMFHRFYSASPVCSVCSKWESRRFCPRRKRKLIDIAPVSSPKCPQTRAYLPLITQPHTYTRRDCQIAQGQGWCQVAAFILIGSF